MKQRVNQKLKIISGVLALTLLHFLALPVPAASQQSELCGDNITWSYDSASSTLTLEGTGDMYDMFIDSVTGRKPSYPWHENGLAAMIETVIVGEGITSLGDASFSDCFIETIKLPNTLLSIGDYALQRYRGSAIKLPESLEHIGTQAFYGSNLIEVDIPSSVKTVGDQAFAYNHHLESVNIGSGLTELGTSVFSVDYALSGITVSKDNEFFMSDANVLFSKDKKTLYTYPAALGEKSYTVPDTVTKISDCAFSRSASLTTIALPSGLLALGERCFEFCTSLDRISIPDNVSRLPIMAFGFCTSLTHIDIGEGVTSIDDFCFQECDSLKSFIMPESLTTLGDAVFRDCDELTEVVFGSRVSDARCGLFPYCPKLEKVTIPDSVRGLSALTLTDSGYFNNEKNWDSGALYIGNHLLAVNDRLESAYEIREGTVTVAMEAFMSHQTVSEITVPESVKHIGSGAFAFTDELKKLTVLSKDALIHDYMLYVNSTAPLKIYGYSGSTIERWCTENHADFLAINECEHVFSTEYTVDVYATATTPGIKSRHCLYCNGAVTDPVKIHWIASIPFTDCEEGKWYSDAVSYALTNALFKGVSETEFAPNAEMTRAMLVVVLYRIEGKPQVSYTENPFTDVEGGRYYTDAVLWANENGIVNGTGQGTFSPTNSVTREQLATILYRYSVKKDIDTTVKADLAGFPDAGNSASWAKDALEWAFAKELITGSLSGGKVYLNPKNGATRAQVALILMRYFNSIATS